MSSLAVTDPPGELILRMTALTCGSLRVELFEQSTD
jgi:hypothetical protein